MKPSLPTSSTKLRRDRKRRWHGDELDHFVRALSHDMNANFMLLENSFRQVKRSCGRQPIKELAAGLEHVEACLQETKRFLDDLVALGNTGSVPMAPERVDMTALVKQVFYEQRQFLAERNVEPTIAASLPAVWCNAGRVKQVVTNLVRNAAKHGCDPLDPRITVAHVSSAEMIRLAEPYPSSEQIWIRVHDNGPGIPGDEQDAVFLPGRRLATAADGTGMGLAIVRKVVRSFGGEVLVDPRCRQGTAILFSLPAVPHDPASGSDVQ